MVVGAQGAVHFPADVQALDIDFFLTPYTGPKLYGPTRIGALYGKSVSCWQRCPLARRRENDQWVSFDGTLRRHRPLWPEAGTPNVAG